MFKRPNQHPNSGVTSTLLNRLGRAALANALSVVEAIFGTDSVDGTRRNSGIVGDGFFPSATGTTNEVKLQRGLAWIRDNGAPNADWEGEVRPMLLDSYLAVAMPTNNDVNPRVDIIVIRPIISYSDEADVKVKDAPNGPIRVETTFLTRTYGVEVLIVAGTPAPVPTIPVTPSGTIKICDVLRPSSVVNVASTDVTDRRSQDNLMASLRADRVEALRELVIGRRSQSGEWVSFERAKDTESFYNEGDIVVTDSSYDDSKPNGKMHIRGMRVYDEFQSNWTPFAMCAFGVQDWIGGALSDNTDYPQQVVKGPISSIKHRTGVTVTRTSGGGPANETGIACIEIALSAPLSSVNNAIVVANSGFYLSKDFEILACEVVSTTLVRVFIQRTDADTATLADVLALRTDGLNIRAHVLIYDMGRFEDY